MTPWQAFMTPNERVALRHWRIRRRRYLAKQEAGHDWWRYDGWTP